MGMSRLFDHDAAGDDRLCSFEVNLWKLTYHCLLKFGCPVLFHVWGPNVPQKVSQHINFFVPTTHPKCHEVVEFLKEELRDEVREETPQTETQEWWYGVRVTVSEYSGQGSEPYLEREYQRELSEQFVDEIRRMLENLQSGKETKFN